MAVAVVLLIYLLALVGAVNLLILLAQAPALVHGLYLNAENATALVLPALVGHAAKPLPVQG